METRSIAKATGAVCCVALAGAFALAGARPAQAAAYKSIPIDAGAVVKSGGFYFTVKGSRVYVSAKRKSGFEKTPMQRDANLLSNGKRVYYAQHNRLYRYELSSRENVRLKTLKNGPRVHNDVSAVHKRNVYITLYSDKTGRWSTYLYDTVSGRYALQYENCQVCAHEGAYTVGRAYQPGDVSPYPLTLYRLDGKGMHKAKRLAKFGMLPTFAGGKLYFCSYGKSGAMKKTTLFCCNKNGGGKKKIVTLRAKKKGGYPMVTPTKITARYIVYIRDVLDLTMWRYTYATKKNART